MLFYPRRNLSSKFSKQTGAEIVYHIVFASRYSRKNKGKANATVAASVLTQGSNGSYISDFHLVLNLDISSLSASISSSDFETATAVHRQSSIGSGVCTDP